MGRRFFGCVVVTAMAMATLLAHNASAGPTPPDVHSSDFNGDGFSDLAVGVPFADVGGRLDAGAVDVLYGGPTGVGRGLVQHWTQDSPGIADQAERFDSLGWAVAAGDFNGDGFADLAMDVAFEDGALHGVGAVHVLYGGEAGLTAGGSQLWTARSIGEEGQPNENLGTAVVAGDFNGDGRDDLAIGDRERDVNGEAAEDAGGVIVLYGTADGLRRAGHQLWTQDSPGVIDRAEPQDRFGVSLAAGDFDGDGFDELAAGVLGEDLGSPTDADGVGDAGAVAVLRGSAEGLTADGDELWTEDSPGVAGRAEGADLFGSAVAAGDLTGDQIDDLAIGAFAEDVAERDDDAGAVTFLLGSAEGLISDGSRQFTEDSPGIQGNATPQDHFGDPVAIGDFDGDGLGELVASFAEEAVFGHFQAGAIYVFGDSAAGPTTAGGRRWTQNREGVGDLAENDDHFGSALAVGQFGLGANVDLAVASRGEDTVNGRDSGAVQVLSGGPDGLSGRGSRLFAGDDAGDWFGFTLAASA